MTWLILYLLKKHTLLSFRLHCIIPDAALSVCALSLMSRTGYVSLLPDHCRLIYFLSGLRFDMEIEMILKIIYRGSFKYFVALYADRICSDQHFVENCIEKFPSV